MPSPKDKAAEPRWKSQKGKIYTDEYPDMADQLVKTTELKSWVQSFKQGGRKTRLECKAIAPLALCAYIHLQGIPREKPQCMDEFKKPEMFKQNEDRFNKSQHKAVENAKNALNLKPPREFDYANWLEQYEIDAQGAVRTLDNHETKKSSTILCAFWFYVRPPKKDDEKKKKPSWVPKNKLVHLPASIAKICGASGKFIDLTLEEREHYKLEFKYGFAEELKNLRSVRNLEKVPSVEVVPLSKVQGLRQVDGLAIADLKNRNGSYMDCAVRLVMRPHLIKTRDHLTAAEKAESTTIQDWNAAPALSTAMVRFNLFLLATKFAGAMETEEMFCRPVDIKRAFQCCAPPTRPLHCIWPKVPKEYFDEAGIDPKREALLVRVPLYGLPPANKEFYILTERGMKTNWKFGESEKQTSP